MPTATSFVFISEVCDCHTDCILDRHNAGTEHICLHNVRVMVYAANELELFLSLSNVLMILNHFRQIGVLRSLRMIL